MKTRSFISAVLLALWSIPALAQTVTISGRVTDYNGNPIDSVSVHFQRSDFSTAHEALTDKDGKYSLQVAKGKYQAVAAINMATYPHTAAPGISQSEQRLEFWAYNYIADRDTTLNIQYHRMEAYGLYAFRIPGATPGYVIYVRPMSLSRYQQWSDTKSPVCLLAPPADKLEVAVSIDSETVPVRMVQEVKEYFAPGEYGNAYLITVDLPKQKTTLPYLQFKVVLKDLENGDKGEGIYFYEKKQYF